MYASPDVFLHFLSNCLKLVVTVLLSAHSLSILLDFLFRRLSLELEQHNVNKHAAAWGVGNGFREIDRRKDLRPGIAYD